MPKVKAAATKTPKFSTIPISQLKLDKGNVRRHDKRSAEAIGASVKAFGAARSVVVDRDNILRAGNGTLAAAKAAGIKEAIVVEASGEQLVVVKRSGWSKAEAAAYGVADNRTTDLSRFDEPDLAALLAKLSLEGAPLGSIGYTEPELARIMARDGVEERLSAGVAGSMGQRFGVPPFTTLDARQGYWQERKREWISVGLKSEVGRKVIAGSMNTGKGSAKNSLTGRLKRDPDDDSLVVSIFDPVLCEILYAWFCPPGGRMLDPFAGGSVRGVVAAVMGRSYVGVDIQTEQVKANREQWAEIKPRLKRAIENSSQQATVTVKVSAASARQEFNGCEPKYIAEVCHASCCDSSTDPAGCHIAIHPSEAKAVQLAGGRVEGNLLQPDPKTHKCPFKNEAGLCGIHGTPAKPFGCIASPFTLNRSGTLIIRNRYRLLKCYKDGARLPAYKAFAQSLVTIFGREEAKRITAHLDAGGGDLAAQMPRESWQRLQDNDAVHHAGSSQTRTEPASPEWVVGDSRNTAKLLGGRNAGLFDFVFSCPPYADLEVYSDDERDLSTMTYADFIKAYRKIIESAVALLKPNRFACFVVGEARGKDGNYYGLVPDTIKAFQEAGAQLYNEAILITAIGSLPLCAGKIFSTTRKLGKTHQNVLVFVKGDSRAATEACGEVALPELPVAADEL